MAYENDNSDYVGPSSPVGFVGDVAWGMTKWIGTMKTLEVLKYGPQRGYPVPFTRGGRIGRFGVERGWWGSGGYRVIGRVEQAGLRGMFRQTSLFGMGAAKRRAATVFGEKAAGSAMAKYITSRAAGFALGPLMAGLLAVDIVRGVAGIYGAVSQAVSRGKYLELGGYFPETQGAYTSRQRAVQAITASSLQARSAIGNEAMLFHRS